MASALQAVARSRIGSVISVAEDNETRDNVGRVVESIRIALDRTRLWGATPLSDDQGAVAGAELADSPSLK